MSDISYHVVRKLSECVVVEHDGLRLAGTRTLPGVETFSAIDIVSILCSKPTGTFSGTPCWEGSFGHVRVTILDA